MSIVLANAETLTPFLMQVLRNSLQAHRYLCDEFRPPYRQTQQSIDSSFFPIIRASPRSCFRSRSRLRLLRSIFRPRRDSIRYTSLQRDILISRRHSDLSHKEEASPSPLLPSQDDTAPPDSPDSVRLERGPHCVVAHYALYALISPLSFPKIPFPLFRIP